MNTVTVKNLVKYYGDFKAVDNLSFNIREGEIFGLLGPNGSGKTTTIGCILSLLKYQQGEIQIFGKEMSPNALDIKAHFGFVPQELSYFEELSVKENIEYFCGLYIKDKNTREKYVEEAIEFVSLEEFKKHYPKELSGGLKRRLNIACGIAHKPKFIILDEPTVAVDPQSRNKILENIKQLNNDGVTILYTSHYMEEIEALCDTILIMDKGTEIAQGSTTYLKDNSTIQSVLEIESYDLTPEDLQEIEAIDHIIQVKYDQKKLYISYVNDGSVIHNVLKFFETNHRNIISMQTQSPTLNDIFLEITGKELRD